MQVSPRGWSLISPVIQDVLKIATSMHESQNEAFNVVHNVQYEISGKPDQGQNAQILFRYRTCFNTPAQFGEPTQVVQGLIERSAQAVSCLKSSLRNEVSQNLRKLSI